MYRTTKPPAARSVGQNLFSSIDTLQLYIICSHPSWEGSTTVWGSTPSYVVRRHADFDICLCPLITLFLVSCVERTQFFQPGRVVYLETASLTLSPTAATLALASSTAPWAWAFSLPPQLCQER